jgi:hypothetical protein
MHKTAYRKNGLYQTSVLSRFPPETNPELLSWYVKEFSKSSPEVLIHYSDLVSSANAAQQIIFKECIVQL